MRTAMKGSSKRSLVATLVVLAAVAVFWLIRLNRQYLRYERAYAALQPGQSEKAVFESFGPPAKVRACEQYLSWDGVPVKLEQGECVQQLWYYSGISLEQWAIGLDAKGLVVSKARLSSP